MDIFHSEFFAKISFLEEKNTKTLKNIPMGILWGKFGKLF
jgi:hypothetical protein